MERNAPVLALASHMQIGNTDCGTALRHIVTGCVQVLERHRSAAIAGDADAVHAMRIELTRLNSALLFFSPILTDPVWRKMESCVRSVNSRLGRARDQDVMLQYSRRRRYRGWAQSRLRSVKRLRAKRYRKLAAHLSSDNYNSLLHNIDRQSRPPARSISDELRSADLTLFAETRLPEWRGEIERLGRHLKKLDRKQQHSLRLKCKYYRYIVDSLLDSGARLAFQDSLFRETAKQVHALLGDVRDLKRFKRSGRGRPPRYRSKKKKLLSAVAAAFHRQR